MPSDLDLALRVRADMREALQGIGALNRSLRHTARRGGEAGAALAGATGAARELSGAFERAPGPEADGTWIDAMQTSLSALGRESERTLYRTRSAAETAFDAMEGALTRFVTTGRLDFSGFVDSVIADLARLAARRFFTQPLGDLLFGLLGGGGAAAPVPIFHAGGTVGAPGGVRRGAGLRADEVPIIAQAGETILPRGATVTPPPLEITFVNQGTPQREVDRTVQLDPKGTVITIVTDDMDTGGPISRSMERRFGVRTSIA
jgi:hypothetical protein